MGHHYLPQKYLLRFAEADGGIWVHDRTQPGSYRTGVRAIANEVNMYSPELESNLNTLVEIPTHHVFDKILDGLPLSNQDRQALAKYISIMWKRVPSGREKTLKLVPGVLDDTRTELMADMDSWVMADPTLHDKVNALREEADAIFEKQRAAPSPQIWHQTFNLHDVGKFEEELLAMNWVFLHSDEHRFLTSDSPVFFFEHEGVGRPESEVTFPISSSVALWATRVAGARNSHNVAPPSFVKQINSRTAYRSSRFVFSETNEPWIKPFTVKGNWSIMRFK
jgi:hypothetical protein